MATVDKIAVELVAKMDGLQRDFAQAGNMAESAGARMRKSFAGVNTALVGLGATLAAGFSVRWLGGLAMDSIRATANLKGLSEETGVAAATLAKMDIAAQISGVGIDIVAKSMNRLAKGMATVDKDSKGIPQALNAIGVDFGKFKNLDPDKQMQEIAKAFDGFQDGAGKSAVAMALFGKEGAALIPFFKDLIENQDLAAGRTQDMIDAADEFDKSLKRLSIVGNDLMASTLGPMVPVMNDLAKALVAVATETDGAADSANALGGSGGFAEFSKSAVNALANVMNAIQVTGRGIKTLTTGVAFGVDAAWTFTKRGGAVGFMADSMMGNLGNVYGSKTEAVKSQVKDIYSEVLTGDKMLAEFNARQNAVQAVERKDKDKSKINFNTAEAKSGGGKSAAKNEDADFDRIVKSLREKIAVQNEELTSTEKLTDAAKEYAKFQQQVADKSITLSPEQIQQAEALFAKMIDGAEKLKQKAQQKVFEAASVSLQEISAAFARDNAKAREALEIMPQSQRSLNASLATVDEKGRTERERLADLELKGNISKEQRIALEKELTEVLAAQKNEISALAGLQDKLNASFEYGTEKALQSYIDEVANVAASAESLMKSAFKGMEDALVEFVSTGKLDFKSLVNSIIADMARITIRQNITGPLAQWMQGIGGGSGGSLYGGDDRGSSGSGLMNIFSSIGRLFFNANGGVYSSPSLSAFSGSIVNRPTAFAFANGAGIMGEAGPEAILPLKRGSNGKLGVQSGGGRAINITVNVSGNSTAPDVRRAAGQGAREALAAFNGAGRYS